MEFLPRKTAHVMSIQTRPTLQDMLKAAMAGTAGKVDITAEANLQLTNHGEEPDEPPEKLAADYSIPTEQCVKLADAVDFVAVEVAKEADIAQPKVEVGKGPGALDVSKAESSEANIDAGQGGSAKPECTPPKNPPIQAEPVQSGKANTGFQDNLGMKHPEQPTDPWGNEKGKISAAVLERLGIKTSQVERFEGKKAPPYTGKAAKGQPPVAMGGKEKAGGSCPKTAAPINLIRHFAGQLKTAEDAINPAKVSAPTVDPAKPPEGASEAEKDVPPQPSDVTSQEKMVGSNQAAIDYTKGQAKADPKSDMRKVLTEPMMSGSGDQVLQKTLDNAGKAGIKIGSAEAQQMAEDSTRISAARALLTKLAADASEKKDDKAKKSKEKESGMGGTPAAATGVDASTMAPTMT
jgi:hypothetical protein